MSAIPDTPSSTSLIVRTAQRYGLQPKNMLATVRAQCFRGGNPTNEQLMAFLIVAERYKLDPFIKQISAIAEKGGGIVPIVPIDGWIDMVNRHPEFDGFESHWDDKLQAETCTMWRKDRSHPCVKTEYLAECRRATEPWKMAHRMMGIRAYIQCARFAFGFSGIYEESEAEAIVASDVVHAPRREASNAERVDRAMRGEDVESIIDVEATMAADAPEPEPPPPTLEHYLGQLAKASDSFVGEMLIEESRDYLSDEELGTLAAAYDARFNTPEDHRE